jgi:hypothetical protein
MTVTADGLMNEMVNGLESFKKNLNELITKDKPIRSQSPKNVLYNSLDSLLKNISLLRDHNAKDRNIKTVYNWFKTTKDFHHNIKSIDKRTSQENYQVYPGLAKPKQDVYIAKNHPIQFEYNNRTEMDPSLMKDKLKQLETRHIKVDSEKIFTRLNSESLSHRTTHYKTGFKSNDFIKEIPKADSKEINIIQEEPIGYSSRISSRNLLLKVDKRNIDSKHKEAAEKRYQEEVKEYLNEWGMAKSYYKEESEKRQDIRKVINLLQNNKPKSRRNLNKTPNIKMSNKDKIFTFPRKSIKQDNEELKTADKSLTNLILKNNIKVLNKDKIINETVTRNKLQILRKNYSNALDIKQVDNPKKPNDDYYPLSLYDSNNISVYSVSKPSDRKTHVRASSVDFVKKNINCGSYLDLRQTVSSFKTNEVNNLHKSLSRNNNKLTINKLKEALLPPVENKTYNKFFLPTPGYGLIEREAI